MIQNKEKFEQFYKKYKDRAVYYALKHKIPNAEDLVQEMFLEIMTKYDDRYVANPKMFWSLLKYRITDAKRRYFVRANAPRKVNNTFDVDDAINRLGYAVPEHREFIEYFLTNGKARTKEHYGKGAYKKIIREIRNLTDDTEF